MRPGLSSCGLRINPRTLLVRGLPNIDCFLTKREPLLISTVLCINPKLT